MRNKLQRTRLANKIIANFFSSVQALASKPVYTGVVINIFYYIPLEQEALSSTAINSVGELLSKLFRRPVELRLVRLHYPYLNSDILAQYIAINTAKYNFTRIISRASNAIFSSIPDFGNNLELVTIPSYITGMKVKISGRLLTQRSVPRQSVQTVQVGSFACDKVESASYTSKNKKGAFTVKVWIGQSLLKPL